MYIDKKHILYFFIAILGVLYAMNIFLMANLTDALVVKPVKLSFIVLQAPVEECVGCSDGENIVTRIDATHNIKYKKQTLAFNSELSNNYISMYNISNLPAIIISGDIENENIAGSWKALSAEKRQDSMVIESMLPYYDIETKSATGIVDVILIKDDTCTDCFNEKTYLNIFAQFGVFPNEVITYDVSSAEGKDLIKKYNITKIPMVILSSGVGSYPNFTQAWNEVGTIENNGWYIFREVQKLGLEYKSI